MRILLTNDDGFGAAGLSAALDALVGHEVYVAAPTEQMSAVSARLTIREPVVCRAASLPGAAGAWEVEGTPVDCVKLVSKSPEDLLRKHPLLLPGSRLRREALIEVDDSVDDRELTAEVSLPRWVAMVLLGETDREPIGPDTRIAFHEYLKGLDDSEQFYRDLDS